MQRLKEIKAHAQAIRQRGERILAILAGATQLGTPEILDRPGENITVRSLQTEPKRLRESGLIVSRGHGKKRRIWGRPRRAGSTHDRYRRRQHITCRRAAAKEHRPIGRRASTCDRPTENRLHLRNSGACGFYSLSNHDSPHTIGECPVA